jgi:predicted TPR repeat methyltransferase
LIVKLAHRILANELAYDAFQTCVGSYRFRRRYLQSINILPESKIVELGCGTGITLKTIHNNDYIGIDLSANYLEKASKRKEFSTLIKGDVALSKTYENLSTKKNDVVLALALWHHLDDNQMVQTLENVYKISEKGTSIFSLDPFVDGNTGISATWIAKNDRGKYLRSAGHLKEISEAAGFRFSHEISRRELYIPTNVIKCTFRKL